MADTQQLDAAFLSRFGVVVFLSTSGQILNAPERASLSTWLAAGGAFVGIHSASACEYDWTGYEQIVGAYLRDHPAVQTATVVVEDATHPSTALLPSRWSFADEWYNFRSNPRERVHVLPTVDESTYRGGTMGSDHPVVWCNAYGRGRTWYTALGHTSERFEDPLFRQHLAGALVSSFAPFAPIAREF